MGIFSDPDCADCRNCNLDICKNGKYLCEDHRDYVKANNNAKRCPDFKEVMGRSAYKKEEARKHSNHYAIHGYYVMTAITNILGLDEDNEYLTKFKILRDEIMPNDDTTKINNKSYDIIINQYEDIGPIIKEGLEEHPNGYDICRYYEDIFLKHFVNLMNESSYMEAAILYFNIVIPGIRDALTVRVKEDVITDERKK